MNSESLNVRTNILEESSNLLMCVNQWQLQPSDKWGANLVPRAFPSKNEGKALGTRLVVGLDHPNPDISGGGGTGLKKNVFGPSGLSLV